MQLETRKLLDRAFSGLSVISVLLMAGALIIILGPMMIRGLDAFFFRGTTDWRIMMMQEFARGDIDAVEAERAAIWEVRRPVFEAIEKFEAEIEEGNVGREPGVPRALARIEAQAQYGRPLRDLKQHVRELLGPFPSDTPVMPRSKYGATRWDLALVHFQNVMYVEKYTHTDPTQMGALSYEPRSEQFVGTPVEEIFPYIEENLRAMMNPKFTFYPQFLTDSSRDANIFGGIWPEILGTTYLAIGAMVFAVPIGVIAAIYLVEYAGDNRFVRLLRSCVSTLAGVPSIVFGLFGLAFFINGIGVSTGRSVLAGSLTLALLVLPVIIRASEEAIRAVPKSYKEAALSLGASKWRTVLTVLLPAALPGILTGIIISLGRAAGETAPIIFTAAWALAPTLRPSQVLTEGTRALPWNIYNIATEHERVEFMRHIQFGMVFTLVTLVLSLNAIALFLRARISKRLRG